MNFPKVLDHAQVLYFTPQASYGAVYSSSGEIADVVRYLAICKYGSSNTCYLFGCNARYEVVSDIPLDSIEDCMAVASRSYASDISWIAAV